MQAWCMPSLTISTPAFTLHRAQSEHAAQPAWPWPYRGKCCCLSSSLSLQLTMLRWGRELPTSLYCRLPSQGTIPRGSMGNPEMAGEPTWDAHVCYTMLHAPSDIWVAVRTHPAIVVFVHCMCSWAAVACFIVPMRWTSAPAGLMRLLLQMSSAWDQ